jgi:hypothetical protein
MTGQTMTSSVPVRRCMEKPRTSMRYGVVCRHRAYSLELLATGADATSWGA